LAFNSARMYVGFARCEVGASGCMGRVTFGVASEPAAIRERNL
jgi:hypothetical protein